MKSLIQKLVETPGPSGFEYKIRDVIRVLTHWRNSR